MEPVVGGRSGPLRNPAAAFAMALGSLLVIATGLVVDGWMLTQPTYVPTSCVQIDSGTSCDYVPNPAIQLWAGLLIVVVGLVLFVIAWRVDRRGSERPSQTGHVWGWGLPLIWLAVVPFVQWPLMITVTAAMVRQPMCQIYGFIGSTADCPVLVFVPSVLLPGLLGLVPIRWLRATDTRTRVAAIVGSALGVTALAASLLDLLAQGPAVEINYGIFLPAAAPISLGGLGLRTVLWLGSLIALLVIAKIDLRPAASSLRREEAS